MFLLYRFGRQLGLHKVNRALRFGAIRALNGQGNRAVCVDDFGCVFHAQFLLLEAMDIRSRPRRSDWQAFSGILKWLFIFLAFAALILTYLNTPTFLNNLRIVGGFLVHACFFVAMARIMQAEERG